MSKDDLDLLHVGQIVGMATGAARYCASARLTASRCLAVSSATPGVGRSSSETFLV